MGKSFIFWAESGHLERDLSAHKPLVSLNELATSPYTLSPGKAYPTFQLFVLKCVKEPENYKKEDRSCGASVFLKYISPLPFSDDVGGRFLLVGVWGKRVRLFTNSAAAERRRSQSRGKKEEGEKVNFGIYVPRPKCPPPPFLPSPPRPPTQILQMRCRRLRWRRRRRREWLRREPQGDGSGDIRQFPKHVLQKTVHCWMLHVVRKQRHY